MGKNYLKGIISSELASISDLNYLMEGMKELTGSIPSEFGRWDLGDIIAIDLSKNRLIGSVPPELANVKFSSLLSCSY